MLCEGNMSTYAKAVYIAQKATSVPPDFKPGEYICTRCQRVEVRRKSQCKALVRRHNGQRNGRCLNGLFKDGLCWPHWHASECEVVW